MNLKIQIYSPHYHKYICFVFEIFLTKMSHTKVFAFCIVTVLFITVSG